MSNDEILRGLLDRGAQTKVGWFSISGRYISETERELR